MFELNVIGYVRGFYTNRKNGLQEPFTRIYCTYAFELSGFTSCDFDGQGTETIFIKRLVEDLCVGNKIIPVYNKYGSCVDIKIC